MADIIIDQDKLEKAADEIADLSTRLQNMRTDIENHLQGLEDGFNTPAGRKYIRACKDNLLDPMDKMKQVIDHVSKNLTNASNEYKSVFNEYEQLNNAIKNL